MQDIICVLFLRGTIKVCGEINLLFYSQPFMPLFKTGLVLGLFYFSVFLGRNAELSILHIYFHTEPLVNGDHKRLSGILLPQAWWWCTYQVNEACISGETDTRHRGSTVAGLNPKNSPKFSFLLKKKDNEESTCNLASASSEHFSNRS